MRLDNFNLGDYSNIIFDCDGIIIDSNKIKTRAFGKICDFWAPSLSRQFMDYHELNGGISRIEKFKYLRDVLEVDLDVVKACQLYSEEVWNALSRLEVNTAVRDITSRFPNANFAIVSGGAQKELIRLFNEVYKFNPFKLGIFGNPRSKLQIIDDEFNSLEGRTVFIGDSRYDYEVSKHSGFDFIFVSCWSEFKEHSDFFSNKVDVLSVKSLEDLL